MKTLSCLQDPWPRTYSKSEGSADPSNDRPSLERSSQHDSRPFRLANAANTPPCGPATRSTDSGATRAARSRTPEARDASPPAPRAGRREKYYNPGAYLLKKVSGYPGEGSANLQSPVRRVCSVSIHYFVFVNASSHTTTISISFVSAGTM